MNFLIKKNLESWDVIIFIIQSVLESGYNIKKTVQTVMEKLILIFDYKFQNM